MSSLKIDLSALLTPEERVSALIDKQPAEASGTSNDRYRPTRRDFVTALAATALSMSPVPVSGLIREQREGHSHMAQTQTMSYSISTLLMRNLQDVFGENDPERRRAAVGDIYTDDVVFYEPSKNVYRGRDEIERVAGALRAKHPDFRYQPIAAPEEIGNGGRIQWVEGRPGGAPEIAGTDFIIARDGRIAAIYLFFDKQP